MADHDLAWRPNAVHVLVCVECGCMSGLRALGWRGYRIDDPEDEDATPELGWFCPRAAAREFFESV